MIEDESNIRIDDIPPAKTPVQVSPEQAANETALAAAETEVSLDFGDGLMIHPTEINGLDERRIRIASGGHFDGSGALFNALSAGSMEAVGAIYWIARLKADGLKPDTAPYSYDDCIEAIDVSRLVDITDRSEGTPDPL